MDDMLEDKRRSKGEATRMALLEAALVLFGERGFEGTSTRDIAGLAGCNRGSSLSISAARRACTMRPVPSFSRIWAASCAP